MVADDGPLKRMRQQLEAQMAASEAEATTLAQAHAKELGAAKAQTQAALEAAAAERAGMLRRVDEHAMAVAAARKAAQEEVRPAI